MAAPASLGLKSGATLSTRSRVSKAASVCKPLRWDQLSVAPTTRSIPPPPLSILTPSSQIHLDAPLPTPESVHAFYTATCVGCHASLDREMPSVRAMPSSPHNPSGRERIGTVPLRPRELHTGCECTVKLIKLSSDQERQELLSLQRLWCPPHPQNAAAALLQPCTAPALLFDTPRSVCGTASRAYQASKYLAWCGFCCSLPPCSFLCSCLQCDCCGASGVDHEYLARVYNVGCDASGELGWIALEPCNSVSLLTLVRDFTRYPNAVCHQMVSCSVCAVGIQGPS